jgi:hypothetical protein
MPTYPVKNLNTGETKTIVMSIDEYTKWRQENKDWDKDWSKGCASLGEVGEWKDKLLKQRPGWNDVLEKASQAPGSKVKKI